MADIGEFELFSHICKLNITLCWDYFDCIIQGACFVAVICDLFIYKCTCMYVFIAPLRDYLRRWCSTWCHLILLIILIAPCCFEIWRPIPSFKKMMMWAPSFGPLHPKWAKGRLGRRGQEPYHRKRIFIWRKGHSPMVKVQVLVLTYKRDLDTLRTPLFFKTAIALHNRLEDFISFKKLDGLTNIGSDIHKPKELQL